jgi:hypothetical protein
MAGGTKMPKGRKPVNNTVSLHLNDQAVPVVGTQLTCTTETQGTGPTVQGVEILLSNGSSQFYPWTEVASISHP